MKKYENLISLEFPGEIQKYKGDYSDKYYLDETAITKEMSK